MEVVCTCACAREKLRAVRPLSCAERLPVSGRLSWLLFIWPAGAASIAAGRQAGRTVTDRDVKCVCRRAAGGLIHRRRLSG